MKKCILLISENGPDRVGGIERHCFNIMEMFESGEEVEIKSVSKSDIRHSYWNFIGKTVFSFSDLKNAISNSRCDVVHVHGFASVVAVQSLIAARKLKKKLIFTAHYHPFETLDNPRAGKIFFYLLLKPLLKSISMILTINNQDTEFFKKYNQHVRMIPHWINIPFSKGMQRRTENMILFVGRADANKGIDHLYSIPEGKYEIHCVTGSHISRKDFVVHSSITDQELHLLYERASLVVVPSRYEAFSYVALESLAHGTPIVISRNVQIKDYVDGCRGISTFTYGDYKAFNTAIENTINAAVDTEAVAAVFDKSIIRSKLLNIYLEA